jgi:hypothetical protein
VAAVLLPEVKDRMPDEVGNKRAAAALNKLLTKSRRTSGATTPGAAEDDPFIATSCAATKLPIGRALTSGQPHMPDD